MIVSLFCSVSGHQYSNRRKNGWKYTGWVNTWQSLQYHEWHAIPYLLKKNPHWPDLYIQLKGSCKQFLLIFLSLLWCFFLLFWPFSAIPNFSTSPLNMSFFLYYYMVVYTKVVFSVPHFTHSFPANFFICQSQGILSKYLVTG